MPDGGTATRDPQAPVNKDALYAKFKTFVEQMSPGLKTAFETSNQSEIDAAVDEWFTPAEKAVLIEDAQALAPDQPPGALGYWIW